MRQLVLVLLADGGAELLEDDRTLWASGSDDGFLEEFPDLLGSDDDTVLELLDYLVDAGVLTDEEADHAAVDVETLDDSPTPDAA